MTRLAPHEVAQREHGAYTSDALKLMNNYDYSNKGFSLSEEDAEELDERLQVGKSIITFNADQLRGTCYSILVLHELFRRNVLLKKDVALKEPTLNSKQIAMALEFYLQMDGKCLHFCKYFQSCIKMFAFLSVDIFYMKTCSFRGAEPTSTTAGLFCDKHEPLAGYTMVPCGNLSCLCCHPINSGKKSQSWSVVDFFSSSMHQFVNGYTTYLNCPAVYFSQIFQCNK